jgi:hypothetical protein
VAQESFPLNEAEGASCQTPCAEPATRSANDYVPRAMRGAVAHLSSPPRRPRLCGLLAREFGVPLLWESLNELGSRRIAIEITHSGGVSSTGK